VDSERIALGDDMKYLLLLSTILTQSALGAGLEFTPSQGKITFLAKGRPALISIKGEGEGAKGVLREEGGLLQGELSFLLSTLKTGIELRDQHMKTKYLETEKFPETVLTIKGLPKPPVGSPTPFEGSLRLHGVDSAVKGVVTLSEAAAEKILKAEFTVKLSQFKIEIPSFKGITVAEDVTVQVETRAREL